MDQTEAEFKPEFRFNEAASARQVSSGFTEFYLRRDDTDAVHRSDISISSPAVGAPGGAGSSPHSDRPPRPSPGPRSRAGLGEPRSSTHGLRSRSMGNLMYQRNHHHRRAK